MSSKLSTAWSGVELSDPKAVLKRAFELYHPRLSLACSFSLEDVSLIHMAAELGLPLRVFALDTGRLHPETYECAERVCRKYELDIDWYLPAQRELEQLLNEQGLFSFRESVEARRRCCGVRKVEGLKRALSGVDAWMTGLRQTQSVTRDSLQVIETENGRVKINPLCSWTLEETKDYVKQNQIPYNQLYDRGYTSIGCAPCTRAVPAGGQERDGRWWWESAEKKECGIHWVERDGQMVIVRASQTESPAGTRV